MKLQLKKLNSGNLTNINSYPEAKDYFNANANEKGIENILSWIHGDFSNGKTSNSGQGKNCWSNKNGELRLDLCTATGGDVKVEVQLNGRQSGRSNGIQFGFLKFKFENIKEYVSVNDIPPLSDLPKKLSPTFNLNIRDKRAALSQAMVTYNERAKKYNNTRRYDNTQIDDAGTGGTAGYRDLYDEFKPRWANLQTLISDDRSTNIKDRQTEFDELFLKGLKNSVSECVAYEIELKN